MYMAITSTKDGRPTTQDERWEGIKVEQKVRNKYLTDEVYQEAEDGAVWVLTEAKQKAADEIARYYKAQGITFHNDKSA